jgi:hypothetical protein
MNAFIKILWVSNAGAQARADGTVGAKDPENLGMFLQIFSFRRQENN